MYKRSTTLTLMRLTHVVATYLTMPHVNFGLTIAKCPLIRNGENTLL